MPIIEKLSLTKLKIVYFGIYSRGPAYPRNRNIIHALRYRGHEVTEVHYEMAASFNERFKAAKSLFSTLNFFASTLFSYVSLSYRYLETAPHDVIVIGHPGYFHVHLAKFLSYFRRNRPLLIYDNFIPLYNAVVEDRCLMKEGSFQATLLHILEASCCRQASINLVDTDQHGLYLSQEYGLSREKNVRVFVGSTLKWNPRTPALPLANRKFRVVFIGTYIPLHGIETILMAAGHFKQQRDVEFHLVGSGQLKREMRDYASGHELTNVYFTDWVDASELPIFMRKFDLALGIFGSTEKASRVIATKIFDICAVGLPFITSDTAAIREVFEDQRNCYLVPAADSLSLAAAVNSIKNDPALREKIARGAEELYRARLCPNTLCDELLARISAIRPSAE